MKGVLILLICIGQVCGQACSAGQIPFSFIGPRGERINLSPLDTTTSLFGEAHAPVTSVSCNAIGAMNGVVLLDGMKAASFASGCLNGLRSVTSYGGVVFSVSAPFIPTCSCAQGKACGFVLTSSSTTSVLAAPLTTLPLVPGAVQEGSFFILPSGGCVEPPPPQTPSPAFAVVDLTFPTSSCSLSQRLFFASKTLAPTTIIISDIDAITLSPRMLTDFDFSSSSSFSSVLVLAKSNATFLFNSAGNTIRWDPSQRVQSNQFLPPEGIVVVSPGASRVTHTELFDAARFVHSDPASRSIIYVEGAIKGDSLSGRIVALDSSTLTLMSSIPCSTTGGRMTLKRCSNGDVLAVVPEGNQLNVWNFTTPNVPFIWRNLSVPLSGFNVLMAAMDSSCSFAYVAYQDKSAPLVVWDLNGPNFKGAISLKPFSGNGCTKVVVSNSTLWVSFGVDGVMALNISDASRPFAFGSSTDSPVLDMSSCSSASVIVSNGQLSYWIIQVGSVGITRMNSSETALLILLLMVSCAAIAMAYLLMRK